MIESVYRNSGINFNFIETPKNGSPLLLVHGNMGRWQAFSPIIPDLIHKHHIYALDLRGHGKSSHAAGTYTLQTHMTDVISFINDQIKLSVTIFGMSLGGMIGLMAAAHYPELVQQVIVADSPLTFETLFPIVKSQRDFGHQVIHYLQTKQTQKLYEVLNDDFASESFCACDIDVLVGTFDRYEEMVAGYNMEKLFPAIHCPTLIMRGEASLGSMITDNDMIKAKSLLPTLQDRKITGVGHSLLQNKEIVLETVMQFLAKM